MENAIPPIVGLTILLLGAALLIVWSRRDIPRVRGWAIGLALMASAGAASIVGSTLGYAIPLISGVTIPAGDNPMLSVKLILNRGIYLTIDLPDQPRLYWMPWDKEVAQKLQDLMDGGGGTVSTPPFEWSWDLNPPQFQPLPQPKIFPDKPPEAPSAPHFEA